MKEFLSSAEVRSLRTNLEIFRLRYHTLDDQYGWVKFIDETNRKIYFKKEPGMDIITQY